MRRVSIQTVILEEYNVGAAVVAILTVAYVMMNFLVDVLYSILDPRIRHAAR